MPSIPCPLCNSSRHRVISRFAGAYNVRARIVICRECGFLFRRDPWGEEQVVEFQRKLSQCPDTRRDALAHRHETALRDERSAQRRLRWVRGYVPSPARVVGLGAGSRIFAEAARVAGFDATGIEPTSRAIPDGERREDRWGMSCLDGTDRAEGSFDVVALFSFLERVPDLHDAMATVRRLLRPKGLLIIELPDTMCMTGRPKDYFRPEHNWHFTDRTLGLLLEKEGFPPVDLIQRDTGEEHVLFAATRKDRVPEPGRLCLKNPLEYQRVLEHLRNAPRSGRLTSEVLLRDVATISLGPWLGMRVFMALRSVRNGVAGRTGRLYRTALS